MAAQGARPSWPAPTGQHVLGRRAAAELVRLAGVGQDDLVFEIGAGTGVLTRELAAAARRVIAVELDPALALKLWSWKTTVVEVDGSPENRRVFLWMAHCAREWLRTEGSCRERFPDPRGWGVAGVLRPHDVSDPHPSGG